MMKMTNLQLTSTIILLIILLSGCGGENPTEAEATTFELTPAELTPLLNTQAGRQFAEAPWDVNNDGRIDLFDLMLVAQHFGEEVEGGTGQGTVTLQIVNNPGTAKTIHVTGRGAVLGEPDIALLTLGVSVERDSVQAAREEAAIAMQGVVDSLKANGVDPLDIQTQQFSIHPQFDFIDRQQVLRGYRVTNTVSVTLRDLEQVGQAIDDAAEAAGDSVQIQSIRFAIEDTTLLAEQARVKAMQDAQSKATTLAEEGAVTLGKPLSISEASSAFSTPSFDGRLNEDAIAATPIETGQLQIQVTVNVIYEIHVEPPTPEVQ